MITIGPILAPETECSYLPGKASRLAHLYIHEMTAREYGRMMLIGWRRFGRTMFLARCQDCDECRSLRVDVQNFRPSDSQKRCWKQNADRIRLQIGTPDASPEKLAIYDRYHHYQAETKGWSEKNSIELDSYLNLFVDHPFPTEEWCYYLEDQLVGVGFVDHLPVGYSAIYFYHDPEYRKLGLGTFNILKLLAEAREHGHDYLYLGYYVAECPSLKYKALFQPYQILVQGRWLPGQDRTQPG